MTDLRWDESLTQVALVGTGMGVAHVLSPDHLSALATLSANGGAGAFRLGVRWGVGHSTGMLGMACALLAVTWGGERAAADRGGGGAADARPLDVLQRARRRDHGRHRRARRPPRARGASARTTAAAATTRTRSSRAARATATTTTTTASATTTTTTTTAARAATAARSRSASASSTASRTSSGCCPCSSCPAAALAYLGVSVTSAVVMGGFAAAWGGATRRYAASSAELTFRLAAASSGLSVAVGLLWLGLLATGGLDGAVLGHDHGHGARGHG
ncbi:hypothetical protein JL720_433 [Aureococcus anophagefferens]|nr:hypothetical protein JL720_433 [Aureococcus anophagefferens]